MIWETIGIVACVVETILIVDFLGRYLGYTSSTNVWLKKLVFVVLEMTNLFVFLEIIHSEIITALGLVVISLAYSCTVLKGSIFEKTFIVFFNIVMILMVNTLTLIVFSRIVNVDFTEQALMKNSSRVIMLGVIIFLYFPCSRLMIKVKWDDSYSLSVNKWLVILVIVPMTIIAGVIMFESVRKKEYSEYVMAVSSVGLVLINILIYVLFHKMSIVNMQKTEITMLQLQLSEQEERMREVNYVYKEALHIRHDIKKCINCAEVLLMQEKYSEAKRYLADLSSEKLGPIQQYVVLKSGVVSAVINLKLSKCTRENIHIETSISDCFDDFSEIDISILLSNLFDNAIEACMKLKEKRYLFFTIYLHKGYLKIMMKNSVDSRSAQNSQLKTNKVDKKKHGFGIKTIAEITNKYNGISDFQIKGDEFVVDIWLKKNESAQ